MLSQLIKISRQSYLLHLLMAIAILASASIVNPASAQTTVTFDFESPPIEGDVNPVFVDGDSGFVMTHSPGAVRGDAQWADDGKCLPHAGDGCMRVSDVGVGATPVTTTINFSEPVDSISIWARTLSPGSITPIVEGGGMLAPIPLSGVYEQYLINGSGPYIGLLMSSDSVNVLMWDDLEVTFGMPVIPREALLGIASEDGDLLSIEPDDADTFVIGNTGVVPLDALAKDPISGTLYGGSAIPGGELTGQILYTYQTIIEMTPHGEEPPPDGIDTLIIDFITEENSGNISAADLEYLSIAFLDGANNFYQDISIIEGEVQAIGGAPRELEDMFWDFNLDTLVLSQIVNASSGDGGVMENSSGVQYQVTDSVAIPIDGELRFQRFTNGDPDQFGIGTDIVQSTRLLRIEGAASLYEIDERTAETRQIGVLGPDISSMNGADFDADGQLWAVVTVEDLFGECEGPCPSYEALAAIDTSTGEADIVGSGLLFAQSVEGISFDGDGTLWGVSSQDHELYQIDLDTGEAEFITDVFVGEGGDPPGDGFQSLQFACDADPFDEELGLLFAGVGEDDGDGGDLYIIDPDTGSSSQVGEDSTTGGSTLGGLALHTTCEPIVAETPTPEGENVTVITVAAFEQVAASVVVAGTTNANFCVVPDIRYTPDGSGGFNFMARNLNLLEVSGMGSCTGPLVPNQPETWESDIFPNLNLVIPSTYQSYRGKFKLPGQAVATDGFWLVLGVVRSTAEFDGPVAYTNFPESLIDYSATPIGERPECTNDLPWRSLDIAGTVPAFGDFPNIEGNRMILETGQCNRNRGLTRRTTHISPVRYVYPKAGSRGELMNLYAQFSGLQATFFEASCADPSLIANMQSSLRTAQMAQRMGNFAVAEDALEEIARSAKNDMTFGAGFSGCPVNRNYKGNFMSRAVTAAFTVHDRFENAGAYVKYFPPADLEIPILDPDD